MMGNTYQFWLIYWTICQSKYDFNEFCDIFITYFFIYFQLYGWIL